jgi:hemerythrin-like domain-containing protein
MRPSEVRRRILSDHELIRAAVSELDSIADRILAGEEHLSGRLRERGKHLYLKLCDHLDLEDAILVRALRDVGNVGAQRADDLEVEHREQRELLTYLVGRLEDSTHPPILLVRDFLGYTSLLRDDMKAEEANLLNFGLLRNDAEAVGTHGT